MKRRLDQRGTASWLPAFVMAMITLFGALGFAVWSFSERQKYKNDVDGIVADAVSEAENKLSDKKDVEFAEREKNPLRTYTGPSAYGTVGLSFPKTWSAYIDESGGANNPLNGFLNPSFVPGVQANSQKYNVALRFQVVGTAYTVNVRALEAKVKSGKIKTTAYEAPKVKGTVGVRVDGEVATGKQGSMVILPLRDKTLKIWTESPQFAADFDTIILPNLSFVP